MTQRLTADWASTVRARRWLGDKVAVRALVGNRRIGIGTRKTWERVVERIQEVGVAKYAPAVDVVKAKDEGILITAQHREVAGHHGVAQFEVVLIALTLDRDRPIVELKLLLANMERKRIAMLVESHGEMPTGGPFHHGAMLSYSDRPSGFLAGGSGLICSRLFLAPPHDAGRHYGARRTRYQVLLVAASYVCSPTPELAIPSHTYLYRTSVFRFIGRLLWISRWRTKIASIARNRLQGVFGCSIDGSVSNVS